MSNPKLNNSLRFNQQYKNPLNSKKSMQSSSNLVNGNLNRDSASKTSTISTVSMEKVSTTNTNTRYSETELKSKYGFTDEIIKQYFSPLVSLGKDCDYTLKQTENYKNAQELKEYLFGVYGNVEAEYNKVSIIENFLNDKNKVTDDKDGLNGTLKLDNDNMFETVKKMQAKVDSFTINDKVFDSAIEKVVKDFRDGNLAFEQVSVILDALDLPVFDKNANPPQKNYYKVAKDDEYCGVVICVNGSTQMFKVDKKAAQKGSDNVKNDVHYYSAEMVENLSDLERVKYESVYSVDGKVQAYIKVNDGFKEHKSIETDIRNALAKNNIKFNSDEDFYNSEILQYCKKNEYSTQGEIDIVIAWAQKLGMISKEGKNYKFDFQDANTAGIGAVIDGMKNSDNQSDYVTSYKNFLNSCDINEIQTKGMGSCLKNYMATNNDTNLKTLNSFYEQLETISTANKQAATLLEDDQFLNLLDSKLADIISNPSVANEKFDTGMFELYIEKVLNDSDINNQIKNLLSVDSISEELNATLQTYIETAYIGVIADNENCKTKIVNGQETLDFSNVKFSDLGYKSASAPSTTRASRMAKAGANTKNNEKINALRNISAVATGVSNACNVISAVGCATGIGAVAGAVAKGIGMTASVISIGATVYADILDGKSTADIVANAIGGAVAMVVPGKVGSVIAKKAAGAVLGGVVTINTVGVMGAVGQTIEDDPSKKEFLAALSSPTSYFAACAAKEGWDKATQLAMAEELFKTNKDPKTLTDKDFQKAKHDVENANVALVSADHKTYTLNGKTYSIDELDLLIETSVNSGTPVIIYGDSDFAIDLRFKHQKTGFENFCATAKQTPANIYKEATQEIAKKYGLKAEDINYLNLTKEQKEDYNNICEKKRNNFEKAFDEATKSLSDEQKEYLKQNYNTFVNMETGEFNFTVEDGNVITELGDGSKLVVDNDCNLGFMTTGDDQVNFVKYAIPEKGIEYQFNIDSYLYTTKEDGKTVVKLNVEQLIADYKKCGCTYKKGQVDKNGVIHYTNDGKNWTDADGKPTKPDFTYSNYSEADFNSWINANERLFAMYQVESDGEAARQIAEGNAMKQNSLSSKTHSYANAEKSQLDKDWEKFSESSIQQVSDFGISDLDCGGNIKPEDFDFYHNQKETTKKNDNNNDPFQKYNDSKSQLTYMNQDSLIPLEKNNTINTITSVSSRFTNSNLKLNNNTLISKNILSSSNMYSKKLDVRSNRVFQPANIDFRIAQYLAQGVKLKR